MFSPLNPENRFYWSVVRSSLPFLKMNWQMTRRRLLHQTAAKVGDEQSLGGRTDSINNLVQQVHPGGSYIRFQFATSLDGAPWYVPSAILSSERKPHQCHHLFDLSHFFAPLSIPHRKHLSRFLVTLRSSSIRFCLCTDPPWPLTSRPVLGHCLIYPLP